MSYEISLSGILGNKDPKLSGRLPQIRNTAEPLMSYTHGKFPYYTPHDFLHSIGVEENLNWIVPDQVKEKMNPYEIFFLIVAAWLHDWGMIAEEGESQEKVREEHHIRTETYLEKLYEKVHLSEHEARIIGKICKGHRKVDLNEPEYEDLNFGQGIKVRVKFLAALLRIADECDISHNRTPEVVYYSINPHDKAEVEFRKHLSITGVGQRDEKHKIYISAIAKDPKGARALREVEHKIQYELNAVKSILAENEVTLDVVELQLETKGFIDQPIGFEINRQKIVTLLIGDHLYKNQDVAIRELVQNSIDSCKLRETREEGFIGKILLKRIRTDELIVEDNGLGMDYSEAKSFLSSIGDSFYDPEVLKEKWGESSYSPISKFGIGILSSFLISDGVKIETLKKGHEACKFSIGSVSEEWKYEKGSRNEPGTTIILELNRDGRAIKLEESLKRYLICPEIQIEYTDLDSITKTFESAWDADIVFERFGRHKEEEEHGKPVEILNLKTQDYDLIVIASRYGLYSSAVLFNHGIYVGNSHVSGLEFDCELLINLKRSLVDIHISRESVKENAKWSNFIYSITNNIFSSLYKQFRNKSPERIISVVSRMLERRIRFEVDSENELLENNPFIKSFVEHAPLLVVHNGDQSIVEFGQVLNNKEIKIYNSCSKLLMDEIDLITKLSSDTDLVINPYDLPTIVGKSKPKREETLLQFILNERGIKCTKLNFRFMLLGNAVEVDVNYPELIPDNVRLATFGSNMQPLVVVREPPVVKKHVAALGTAYWGNILLWKQLLDKGRAASYLNAIKESYDDRLERISIIKEHTVYIDLSDAFINSIFEERKKGEFDNNISENVRRYLNYLSYLPLVVHDIASCLIFLEAIDKLEAEIAVSLRIERPLPLFQRMKPSSNLFLEYFRKFGLDYAEG